MRGLRLHCKRLSLWIILALQILLISTYFLVQIGNPPSDKYNLKERITFVKSQEKPPTGNKITYHTAESIVTLSTAETAGLFVDFNSSLCYKGGTDLKAMQRSKSPNWQCHCLPNWHGSDCGQPEVIWRALLAYRKPIILKGPRKYQRRIVFFFKVDQFSLTTSAIRIEDLNSYVDLFVLYENENYLIEKLQHNFLKEYHRKILYIKDSNLTSTWQLVKGLVNLREDDVILVGGPEDLPNGLALQFVKLYDKWPQPLLFRYRWSVYGFFWMYPSKTVLKGGAATAAYVYENLNNKIEFLYANKTASSNKGLIVGDLNHFGGWFCQFCYEALTIIDYLNAQPLKINEEKKIDNSYIEDLIENGVYIDGKTELLRTHRSQEPYFAPPFVVNNSWKYDWLLINLYSKMDYY